jgi:uroporphyrinogen decarboxylase
MTPRAATIGSAAALSRRRDEVNPPRMKPPIRNDRFLRACRRQPVDATPVWFMRQAGRYMPEYRAIRAQHSLLEICKRPELAAEVTLQPVERLGVDAAILFADILLLVEPLDVGLEFASGDGPVLRRPITGAGDVERLRPYDVATELGFVADAVRAVIRRLDGRVPLIGFAGGPFTVASYLIEGGHSRTFIASKRFMYREPEAWHRLLSLLATLSAAHLRLQVEAGVDAIQLFDSWIGVLSAEDYRRFVAPHTRAILADVAGSGVPMIHFGTETTALLADLKNVGADVIGIDWRIDLAAAWNAIGPEVAIQGNLDPALLFAPWPVLSEAARRILTAASGRSGHIFNLGHGILPETPVESAANLVTLVHEESAR